MRALNTDGNPISDEFKALWQAKIRGGATRERRRIAYKRRYYNGSAYVNEAAWSYLYEQDFVGWGEIPWELDSPLQNVFRTGVVTLKLNNERNQWVQSTGTPSFFAADDTAPNGYRIFKTLIQLQVGYLLADGTTEWVAQFTGYVLGPKLSTQQAIAELRVASKSAFLLEKSDAASVSTVVTLENCSPATGDGSNVDFKTTSTGVGRITDLQVNGTSVDLADYVSGNLNEVVSPNNDGLATITFDNDPGVVPGAGETVKVSLVKWLQNQSIEDLLGAVADEAGIAAGDQNIDSVLIEGSATGSQTINTQAEFEAYLSAVNLSTTSVPGSIQRKWYLIDDFSDGELTSNPVWTVSGSAGVSSGKMNVYNGDSVYTAFTKATGTFEAKISQSSGNTSYWSFVDTGSNSYDLVFTSGGYLVLCKNRDLVGGIIAYTSHSFSSEKTYRVTRDSNGAMVVYVNGVSTLTGTDNSYTTSSRMSFSAGVEGSSTMTVDDIYWSPDIDGSGTVDLNTTVATYQFNLLSVPTSMGLLLRTQDLNGGTVVYKTAGAVDSGGSPGTYDTLVEISANGQMNHTAKQWLKIEVTITPSGYDSPLVHKIVAGFSTSSVTVSLAILDGLTGADAFERYAGLVDYETGDDGDGARFFRAKTTSGSAAVVLTQENAIVAVTEYDPGHDQVFTLGRARFDDHIEEYDAVSAGASSPTPEDEYGRIPPPGGQLDLTGVLLANDVNLAAARARLLYERNSVAKRRIRMTIWAPPWLELGDKINVTVFDDPLVNHTAVVDPLPRAGGGRFGAGEFDVCLANALDMKVLQYKPNFDTGLAEVYAEEILA